MKNILLVNPYDFTIINKESTILGLLSLKAVMRNSDKYKLEVLDFNNILTDKKLLLKDGFEENIESMCMHILSYNPDLISIYTMCNDYHISLLLAKKIKEIEPKLITILAGPHSTMTAKETLNSFEFVDYVAMGEGENTIENILDGIFLGDIENTKGLAYRKNDEIIINWGFDYLCNLDELPYLEYQRCDNLKSIDIEVGRGCPFNCTFCSTKGFWGRKFRVKSVPRLINEIEYYKKEYNVNHFNFQHDLFTFKKEYIMLFCTELIKKNIDITWFCSARIDTLDEEMIKKMREAGCTSIFIGIETGSPKIQKLIRKNLKLERIYEVVDLLIKYNIESTFSFIYGFPEETHEDLNLTLKLIYSLKKRFYGHKCKAYFSIWPLNFLPGTELKNEYYDQIEYRSEELKEGFSFSMLLKEKEINSLIQKNKDIFINYYSLKNTKRLTYLRAFIIAFVNDCYEYVNLTVEMIGKLYEFDYLKLYSDIYDSDLAGLKKISKLHLIENNTIKREEVANIFTLLERFIDNNQILKESIVLKEILKFEKNFFMFVSNKEIGKITLDFTYDVYKMKKEKQISEEKNEYRIEFEKDKSGFYIRKLEGNRQDAS